MGDAKVSELLGLGSTGAFILTIIYLEGYSRALRINLFLYFGLNDYFRLAIEWLPPIIVSYVLGIFIDKFFTRVERGATEEEIAARSPYPRFTRWSRKWSQDSIVLVLVIGAILNITLTFFGRGQPDYMLYGFTGAFLWFRVIAWYAKEPKFIKNWSAPWKFVIILFPTLAILAFCYGLYAGKTGKDLYFRPADVQISLQGESTPVTGRMLFLLDQYVVLQGQKNDIAAIPKNQVTKITHSGN